MKKTSLFTSFGFCTALLFVGCSDNDAKDIAGTVVDPNELAETISSSSADEELPSSSSAIQSSSSIIVSSSSSNNGQTAPVNELDSNSLGYYLLQYGINDAAFDSKVFASTITYKENTSAPPQGSSDSHNDGDSRPGTVAAATEFDGQGFRPFVKQNIGALEYYFPEAYEKFPELIDDIKNDNMKEGCGLYMLNVYADSRYAGHILTEVKGDSVTVLDIKADACLTGARANYARFLVSYCGDVDMNPEIVRKVIEVDIPKDKCPQVDPTQEWVK